MCWAIEKGATINSVHIHCCESWSVKVQFPPSTSSPVVVSCHFNGVPITTWGPALQVAARNTIISVYIYSFSIHYRYVIGLVGDLWRVTCIERMCINAACDSLH